MALLPHADLLVHQARGRGDAATGGRMRMHPGRVDVDAAVVAGLAQP